MNGGRNKGSSGPQGSGKCNGSGGEAWLKSEEEEEFGPGVAQAQFLSIEAHLLFEMGFFHWSLPKDLKYRL